ncbi:unnamed protein product [Taenia asiatica]|uniref:Mediator of RNA polymerase II transcription subunit 30 n=1 Tax=Taenia asiatica TaxID=60517 RepID=A0A0R3WCD1_TAEAS|nr:unnamed protein product [Taenia asiatica]
MAVNLRGIQASQANELKQMEREVERTLWDFMWHCVECASSHSGHGSGSGSQHPSSGQHEKHIVVAAKAGSDSRHASPRHHEDYMAVV